MQITVTDIRSHAFYHCLHKGSLHGSQHTNVHPSVSVNSPGPSIVLLQMSILNPASSNYKCLLAHGSRYIVLTVTSSCLSPLYRRYNACEPNISYHYTGPAKGENLAVIWTSVVWILMSNTVYNTCWLCFVDQKQEIINPESSELYCIHIDCVW
jgi:hypothetical protein